MTPCSFVFDSIESVEVFNVIYKLKNRKSTGLDNVQAKFVDEFKDVLSPLLAKLFNMSIMNGIFPTDLKIAKTIPILKPGNDKQLCSSYRPISLLSIFSKIFETLIAGRLRNFLTKFDILYEYQFGFRPGHSTSLALLDSVDDILTNLDEGNLVAGIFIDLSKAFDSLDHTILLNKLYHYGFRGPIHDWLKSYLQDRVQLTFVNNISSSTQSITFGVPQGSVLGPLLFLLYINDIGNIPNLKYKPKLYADDANIFVHSKNYQDLQLNCQNTLNLIYNWVLDNRLTLNIEKTCFMLFSPPVSMPMPNDFRLVINNAVIMRVENIKFLGVWLDNKLDWKYHLKELYNSLNKYIGIFYKLSNFLPKNILKLLYYSIIHSKILYGIEVYANTYLTYLHDVIILNNRLLRIMQNKKRDTKHNNFNTLPIDKPFEFKLYNSCSCSIL